MHTHPAIAALRDDPDLQRRSHTHLGEVSGAWRARDDVAPIIEQVQLYGSGTALSECPDLHALVCDHEAVCRFVGGWQSHLIDGLRAHPLGEVPFRQSSSPGLATMQLVSSGRATLRLLVYEQREDEIAPTTAVFTSNESHECVIAGEASGQIYHLHDSDYSNTQIIAHNAFWFPGTVLQILDRTEARQITKVNGTMLLMQLSRVPEKPCPVREFRLSDDRLVKTSSGDKRASQKVMALAVLGAMDQMKALDTIEALALDQAQDDDVRWEALRQVLAQSTRHGLCLLADLAVRHDDPLQKPASRLQADLFEREPDLARFGRDIKICRK